MSHSKKLLLIFGLSFLSLACALIGSYLATGTYANILNFNRVPFYLSYQEIGFIRRGLVGSFVYAFGLQSQNAVLALSYSLIAVTAISFWSWVVSYQRPLDSVVHRYVFFMLSPALFFHFGYDLGRTDPLNVFFMITGLYLINKRYHFLAGIVACLGILNHESFLFAFLPLMLAFCFVSVFENNNKRYFSLVVILFPPLLANILLVTLGGNNVDMTVVDALLDKYLDAGGAQYYYIKFTSINGNIISSALNFYGSLKLNLYHLALLIIYLLIFVAGLATFTDFQKNTKSRILFWAALSPLFLLLLAIDKGRWISMAIFNLCIVSAYLVGVSNSPIKKSRSVFFAIIIIVGLVLGPMTIDSFYFASKFDNHFKEPKRIFHTE